MSSPVSVAPAESAEIARQADEAKVAANDKRPVEKKETPKDELVAKLRSTKEAIRAAAAKVETDAAKPIAVAAKPAAEPAKETAKEAPAKVAEPAADEGAKPVEPAAKAEPARAADGKFTADPAKTADPAASVEPAKAPLPSHTAEPPPARMSAKAKEEWPTLPEESRNEVLRMGKEFQAGFEKYKTAAERDAGLAEFHDMAAKGGTDVKTALSKYVGMENLLRTDPIAGLHEVAKNVGMSLKDVAAKILNQAPDAVASQADATIRNLTARLDKAEAALNGIHGEKETAKTNSTTEAVTKFAADPANSRFEELSEDIAFFLKSGRTTDLAEAYKLAERLNPAPAAKVEADIPAAAVASSAPAAAALKLVPPIDQAAQTRGQKSIAGTPSAGSDLAATQPSNSIKEALRKAKARAG